ncbi:unnamed protein product [Trichobilharzia szidati]|nr:unnamed protein product [Trichobilharzia szidati]
MTSTNLSPAAPTSEKTQFTDLHIYVIPPNLWNNDLNTTFSQLVKNTVSAGIIRSSADVNLFEFRGIIEQELGKQFLPSDYVFCKQVGHSIGRIQSNQEKLFRIDEFLPPKSELPEIYVIDRQAIDENQPFYNDASQLPQSQQKNPQNQVTILPVTPSGETRPSSVTFKTDDSQKDIPKYQPNPPSTLNQTPQRQMMSPVSESNTSTSVQQHSQLQQNWQQQQQHQNISRPSSHYEQRSSVTPTVSLPVISSPIMSTNDPSNVKTSQELIPVPNEINIVQSTPILHTGDAGLDTISAAIGHQKDILQRLEYEQQKRILQMQAEAEERRRREAEQYARELAKNADHSKRMEELEKELRRWSDEARQTRERLDQLREAWETSLKSKQEEITTLKQGLEMMKKSRDALDGKPTAREIAAQTEIHQLQIQLTEMKQKYSQVREELEERRKAADARLDAVGGEIKDLRRKMSDMHATMREPKPVKITVNSQSKSTCDVGTEASE